MKKPWKTLTQFCVVCAIVLIGLYTVRTGLNLAYEIKVASMVYSSSLETLQVSLKGNYSYYDDYNYTPNPELWYQINTSLQTTTVNTAGAIYTPEEVAILASAGGPMQP